MSAFILNQAGPNVVGNLPSAAYAPEVVSRSLKMILRNSTFMPRVCNSKGKGELKGKGSVLTIPGEPNVVSQIYSPGMPLTTQVNPRAEDQKFTVSRGRYVQTALTQEQAYFSAISNLSALYQASGGKHVNEKTEEEYFDLVLANVHSDNTGNSEGRAGRKSHAYLVGTPTEPVLTFDSFAEMTALSASVQATHKAVAAKLFSTLESVLNEQPTDVSLGASKWAILPEWFAKQMQLSDITLNSGDQSNTMSFFFRDIGALKGIGGFQNVFRSNLIEPVVTAGGSDTTVTAWPVFFGTTDAVCFADELVYDESGVSESTPGRFTRRVWVYDWFVHYPEFLGVAWVTPNDYVAA